MRCPRFFFYRYILGWRREGADLHLVFGEAWHRIMETLLLKGLNPEAAKLGIELGTEYYSRYFTPAQDSENTPKNLGSLILATARYLEKYSNQDNFTVLHTEIGGIVSIGRNRPLTFKIDAIIEDELGVKIIEHKTTGRGGSMFENQWFLSMQVCLYVHAAFCLYGRKTWGALVNGAIFKKTDFEFIRIPIRKTIDMMESWLWEIQQWVDAIELDMRRLDSCTSADEVLRCFPKNGTGCTKYGTCTYHDFCTVWSNPLRRADICPAGFIQEFWNPNEREGIKQWMELT